MLKRTFVEKVGEDYAARLIELFLQNEQCNKPSLSEIIDLLPEADLTIGRIAGLRRDHRAEIEALKAAYLVKFGTVPPPGESNAPLPSEHKHEPARQIAQAEIDASIAASLYEWREGTSLNPYQYAAFKLIEAYGADMQTDATVVGRRVLERSKTLRRFLIEMRPEGFSKEDVEPIVVRIGQHARTVARSSE